MAAAAVLEPPFADWQAGLNKKQSFESTCSALARSPEALTAPQSRALLTRARTLLRSRFTARPFWVAGRELFRSALAQAGSDAAYKQQLQDFIAECDEYLGDGAGTSSEASTVVANESSGGATAALFANTPAPPAPGGYLFEGQLSSQTASGAPPRPQPSLIDLLGGSLAQQLAAATGAGGNTQASNTSSEQGGQADPQAQDPQQEQQQLAPDVLEALERELDAIAVQLMEQTGQQVQPRVPPASKKVVAALPKEQLSTARLDELGGAGTRCPVCMDEFSEGDEVQVMPCCHVFHPPCLAPWLESNNSCPTCRHELLTDDQQYERRKEREREEEEERRGAANAVSHNEFLYI